MWGQPSAIRLLVRDRQPGRVREDGTATGMQAMLGAWCKTPQRIVRPCMTEEDEYPGGWFGPSWGALVCDPARHRPTPVGERCLDCDEVFVDDDQGLTIPGVRDGAVNLRSIHIGCFLREIGVG